MAYDRYEPLGPSADRYLLASILAVLINVNRVKHSQPVEPDDFMPGLDFHRPPDPQDTVMKQKAMFHAIAAAQKKRGKA